MHLCPIAMDGGCNWFKKSDRLLYDNAMWYIQMRNVCSTLACEGFALNCPNSELDWDWLWARVSDHWWSSIETSNVVNWTLSGLAVVSYGCSVVIGNMRYTCLNFGAMSWPQGSTSLQAWILSIGSCLAKAQMVYDWWHYVIHASKQAASSHKRSSSSTSMGKTLCSSSITTPAFASLELSSTQAPLQPGIVYIAWRHAQWTLFMCTHLWCRWQISQARTGWLTSNDIAVMSRWASLSSTHRGRWEISTLRCSIS